MLFKHKDELEKLHSQLENSIPPKAKPSCALLNTIKIQQNLAKQRKYGEAKVAQQKAADLREKEQAIWDEKRAQKIATLETVLISKQKKEKDALDLRVEKVKEELKQQKELALKTAKLKYNNTKQQIKSRGYKKSTYSGTSRELSKTMTSGLNKSIGPTSVSKSKVSKTKLINSSIKPLWK